MIAIISLLIGYLCGSVPFGLLLTRWAGLGDIRAIGSGNIGATNVLRTGNKSLAAATVLLDVLKGVAPVLVMGWLFGDNAALWAGLGAVLGHLFPVWLGFRGGKGVATAFGVLLAVAWPLAAIAGLTWVAIVASLRISSLAALSACVVASIAACILSGQHVAILVLVLAALISARHHANIRRLLLGTEPRIGKHV
jgi:glycerol-3-phosphate acyltransferase PlsY